MNIAMGAEFIVTDVAPAPGYVTRIEPQVEEVMGLAGYPVGIFCCGCFDKKPSQLDEADLDAITELELT